MDYDSEMIEEEEYPYIPDRFRIVYYDIERGMEFLCVKGHPKLFTVGKLYEIGLQPEDNICMKVDDGTWINLAYYTLKIRFVAPWKLSDKDLFHFKVTGRLQ